MTTVRMTLTAAGASALHVLSCCCVLSHTGYLVLRTAAITFTYAIATGLTARAGPAAAACHQVRHSHLHWRLLLLQQQQQQQQRGQWWHPHASSDTSFSTAWHVHGMLPTISALPAAIDAAILSGVQPPNLGQHPKHFCHCVCTTSAHSESQPCPPPPHVPCMHAAFLPCAYTDSSPSHMLLCFSPSTGVFPGVASQQPDG
jgi:hypothetical protein